MRKRLFLILACGLMTAPVLAQDQGNEPGLNPALQALATDFFTWRAAQQPAGGDDLPRVERPDEWLPDWSPRALTLYRAAYREYLARLDVLNRSGFSRADHIDERLLRAAVHRVQWELDVLLHPYRNPLFYVDQTMGSVFELLVLSSPMTRQRMERIIALLNHFELTLQHARTNLQDPVRPFAQAAIASADALVSALPQVEAGLRPLADGALHTELAEAASTATRSLESYATWLQRGLEDMREDFAIGPQRYQWFLANVALLPNTPMELLQQGRQAWNRSVVWDALEKNQNRQVAELPLFDSVERQIEASFRNEREIRHFLETMDLMTVPDWLGHYRNRPMPDYLGPVAFMGVTDDLTSENRLDEDAYSYLPAPSPDLPYFYLASARDPRPIIIHEGVPGHYYQMARSWAHPDPIRRRYIDSSANEGIGFYVEEMLLQAGLFDFSPRSREIIYSFMRLRALRVEVDIRLAIGEFTIDQAGDYLARTVPMDEATADDEAVFFAFNPGQAISYQVGALQIHRFMTDAILDLGDEFSLRHFHDHLMENGNVPIALQRWEYLDRDDDIQRLDELSGRDSGPRIGPPD